MTPHPNPNLPGGHKARRPDTSPTPEAGPPADSSLVRGRVRRFRQRRPVLAALVFAGALAGMVLGLAAWLVAHLPQQSPQDAADFQVGLPVAAVVVFLVLVWLLLPTGEEDSDAVTK